MPRLFTPGRLLARALARDDSENLVGKHGHLFEKSRPRNELASVSGGSSARRECRVHNCAAAVASRAAMAHFPRPICSGAIMRLHMAMRTCAAHAALSYPFFLFLDPLAYLSTSSLLWRRLRDYGTTCLAMARDAGIEWSLRCPLAQCRGQRPDAAPTG